MAKARQSNLRKMQGAVQSQFRIAKLYKAERKRLAVLAADALELRAQELSEDARVQLEQAQAEHAYQHAWVGSRMAKLRSSNESLEAQVDRQRITIGALNVEAEQLFGEVRMWRNTALLLGTAVIILGGLFGNTLI